ncbi:hypothetical protein GLIP_1570 [Aliiglaciecola lipolytica E3]|uniref:Solute-binding protein family 3/N-terminal domain-containing protein n=2 Tax=Aliiglaciecola TaxID=1406885 RepID=K6X0J7_9ALTE|nr:hypothetical protein GLIP_1570 [Aliiglaciecola lipolytica E3]
MIMVSLIVALMLLIAAIIYSGSKPASGPKVILLSSGEWAPYSGEGLPQQGIASVIVRSVIEQMGYQLEIQFMPWSIAQSKAESSQQDSQISGTFPYIRTEQRENQFYFSDPIIDVPNGIFYHRQYSPLAATISKPSDLQNYAVITLAGYEYTEKLRQYIPQKSCNFKDTLQGFEILDSDQQWVLISTKKLTKKVVEEIRNSAETKRLNLGDSLLQIRQIAHSTLPTIFQNEANNLFAYKVSNQAKSQTFDILQAQNVTFIVTPEINGDSVFIKKNNTDCQLSFIDGLRWLAYMSKPKILIESMQVGETLLTKTKPELSAKVGFANYIDYVPHSVMFSKNNPNNLSLKNQFNEVLKRLKSNPQAYNSLLNQATNEIDLADSVILTASSQHALVKGQLYDPQQLKCLQTEMFTFPKGSKALVRQWPDIFLDSANEAKNKMVVASVLNGPLASKITMYCFEPTSVQLQ